MPNAPRLRLACQSRAVQTQLFVLAIVLIAPPLSAFLAPPALHSTRSESSRQRAATVYSLTDPGLPHRLKHFKHVECDTRIRRILCIHPATRRSFASLASISPQHAEVDPIEAAARYLKANLQALVHEIDGDDELLAETFAILTVRHSRKRKRAATGEAL